jgi:uncharacterized membrane protein YkgB
LALMNLDHLVRASMVLIFVLFGYQKWFEYEAQTLVPFISNGPLISWMYLVFDKQQARPRNGCLPRSCSGDSGTRKPEFLEPSAAFFP